MVGGEVVVEEREQLGEQHREVFGRRVTRASQGERGERVGARRAPEAEVDAAGEQRFEHTERLRDLERAVVGQHDAAGPDADVGGLVGHVGHHDLGRRAGDRRGVVVLGEPEAVVPEALDVLREGDGVGEGLRRARARGHRA